MASRVTVVVCPEEDPVDSCGSRNILSTTHRFRIITICFLECLIVGGSFFGWASLNFILVQDGVYRHLCGNNSNHRESYTAVVQNNSQLIENQTLKDNDVNLTKQDTKSCLEQDAELSLAFMIGLVMFGLAALPSGWLFDRYGLWVLRTISWVFAVSGYCLFAFAHDDLSWMVYPGCVLVAVSCSIIILTACHVCELAGKRTALCVTIYTGGLTASTMAYLLLKIGYEHGLSRQSVLLSYIGAWTLVPIVSLTILPRYKVTSPLTYDVPEHDDSEVQPVKTASRQEGESDVPPGGVKGLMQTALYGSLVAWLAIIHMRVGAFIGFYNGWLTQLVNGDMTQDLDLKGMHKAIVALPSVVLTTMATILVSIFVLIPEVKMLYVTILMSEVLRTFSYGTAIAILNMCFAGKHYGMLFGGMYFILGLASTLQVPYTILAEQYGFIPVNGWLLCAALTTTILPIVIIVRHLHRKIT